jgi:hypothetical protein
MTVYKTTWGDSTNNWVAPHWIEFIPGGYMKIRLRAVVISKTKPLFAGFGFEFKYFKMKVFGADVATSLQKWFLNSLVVWLHCAIETSQFKS